MKDKSRRRITFTSYLNEIFTDRQIFLEDVMGFSSNPDICFVILVNRQTPSSFASEIILFSRSEKGAIVTLHKGIAPADSVSVSTPIC
jgi:hypothetical protein